MFSAKLIAALTLVFVAFNAVSAKAMRSQCSQWRAQFGKPNTPKIVAKVMESKVSKSKANRLQRRITPPRGPFNDLSDQTEAICTDHGYDTDKEEGACLWTGEGQDYHSTKYYPGWVNGDHPENCGRTLSLHNSIKGTVSTILLDGCAFAPKGKKISPNVGCSNIWVTRATFLKLGGKKHETRVEIDSWDFTDKPGN